MVTKIAQHYTEFDLVWSRLLLNKKESIFMVKLRPYVRDFSFIQPYSRVVQSTIYFKKVHSSKKIGNVFDLFPSAVLHHLLLVINHF